MRSSSRRRWRSRTWGARTSTERTWRSIALSSACWWTTTGIGGRDRAEALTVANDAAAARSPAMTESHAQYADVCEKLASDVGHRGPDEGESHAHLRILWPIA